MIIHKHVQYTYVGENTGEYVYIPIYKNANTWGKEFFLRTCNWQFNRSNSPNDLTNNKYIIFLRDPIERWISGAVEYLFRKYQEGFDYSTCDSALVTEMIFDVLRLDAHTDPQTTGLTLLDMNKGTFFWINDEFENKVREFTKVVLRVDTDATIDPKKYNKSSHIEFKRASTTKIKNYLDKVPEHRQRIMDFYGSDYNLIKYLIKYQKFYGQNQPILQS